MASESKPNGNLYQLSGMDAQVVSNTMISYWKRRDLKCYALEAENNTLKEQFNYENERNAKLSKENRKLREILNEALEGIDDAAYQDYIENKIEEMEG